MYVQIDDEDVQGDEVLSWIISKFANEAIGQIVINLLCAPYQPPTTLLGDQAKEQRSLLSPSQRVH